MALAHLALDDLLRELCEQVSGVFEADCASILLAEAEDDPLTVVAAVGTHCEDVLGRVGGAGRGLRRAGWRSPARPRWCAAPGARDGGPVRRELESLMGAPLVADGRVQGVLEVGSTNELKFTAGDLDLLQLVADRAARAIEHAQLYARELGRGRDPAAKPAPVEAPPRRRASSWRPATCPAARWAATGTT